MKIRTSIIIMIPDVLNYNKAKFYTSTSIQVEFASLEELHIRKHMSLSSLTKTQN